MERKNLILIIGLLILRIPLLILSDFGFVDKNISLLLYLVLTYLFIAIFIGKNINILKDYYISTSSICIFLISPFLVLLTSPGDITAYPKIFISLLLFMHIIKYGNFNRLYNPKFKVSNIILILIFSATFVFMLFKFVLKKNLFLPSIEVGQFFEIFLFQISYAAVSEEPLFRGMILGGLIKKKIHPVISIILKNFLFWISHFYYMGTGVNFCIIHPIISIFISVVAYHGKNITNSMILHSLVNTLGDIFRYY